MASSKQNDVAIHFIGNLLFSLWKLGKRTVSLTTHSHAASLRLIPGASPSFLSLVRRGKAIEKLDKGLGNEAIRPLLYEPSLSVVSIQSTYWIYFG